MSGYSAEIQTDHLPRTLLLEQRVRTRPSVFKDHINILLPYKPRFSDRIVHEFSSYFDVSVAASVVWWSEFLATDPEIPCSIPGSTKFCEK
jgi:hypothetical protein